MSAPSPTIETRTPPTSVPTRTERGEPLVRPAMDGGDLYRKLLATASHTQQQRHTELHKGTSQHLPGNVFLPAIQQRNSAQSALSMKHLEVIEQCILAENRREEQLAKCPSEKERRYLTKKFIAQRAHECDLLQALMLGRPTVHELEIVDVEAAAHKIAQASTTSPHRRRSNHGVQILSASPDKVIPMHGEKTFTTTTPSNKAPTKAVSPHVHGTNSPARWRQEQAKELLLPECNTSPAKSSTSNRSPLRDRPTRSASLTSASPIQSPSRKTSSESPMARSIAISPLWQPVRKSAKPLIPSPSPTKRKKRVAGTPNGPGETGTLVVEDAASISTQEDQSIDPAVSFAGATSFLEARQQAMAVLGQADGATQTTERTYRHDATRDDQPGRRDKNFGLSLSNEGEMPPTRMVSGYGRPHSSPEMRKRRQSAEAPVLPALSHAPSDTILPRVEFSHDHSGEVLHERTMALTPDDQAKDIQLSSRESEPSTQLHERPADAEETLWAEVRGQSGAVINQSYDGVADLETPSSAQEGDSLNDWDALEGLARDENAVSEPARVHCPGSNDSANESESAALTASGELVDFDCEEDNDHIVLDILYSIIHELENESSIIEPPVEAAAERTIIIEAKPKTLVDVGNRATRIQSAFRGLRARRAFRLALYQQALESGVLGAMPGTQQGYSGWYQDPKSFMAYYFVVRADGEWVQKAVLRCSALVLTHYTMREQILSRVHIPVEDDELM